MDELDIIDELEVNVAPKRTGFLSVLCILTWVGSGLSIIFYGYMYLVIGQLMRAMAELGGSSGDLPNEVDWMLTNYLIGMVTPVFCIIGAVLMWKLRKAGFYIYLLGQLTPIIMSFYTWLVAIGKVNSEGMFFAVLVNIIPIGFIVMYAIQLKNMKN